MARLYVAFVAVMALVVSAYAVESMFLRIVSFFANLLWLIWFVRSFLGEYSADDNRLAAKSHNHADFSVLD